MAKPGYEYEFVVRRRRLLASHPPCAYCGNPATVADHDPPLCLFASPRLWRGRLVPSCARCSARQGGLLTGTRIKARLVAEHAPPCPSRTW